MRKIFSALTFKISFTSLNLSSKMKMKKKQLDVENLEWSNNDYNSRLHAISFKIYLSLIKIATDCDKNLQECQGEKLP